MRWWLLLLLSGCVLPEPAELRFVDGAWASEGTLTTLFVFEPPMSDNGFSDCRMTFDVQGSSSSVPDGCPGCDATMAVDFVVLTNDCPSDPPGFGGNQISVPVGFNDGRGFLDSGGSWEPWVQGERDGASFTGNTSAQVQGSSGFSVRDELAIAWVEPAS